MSASTKSRPASVVAWWLILCLVGLDYFSTLAYLPSLAVQAAGAAAPLAAIVVALTTLCVALPVYCHVVARSPDGTGGDRPGDEPRRPSGGAALRLVR
uniref:Amino acid transporter n=1 Tax=Schlesneria paludicola TaxID=360056 RepID=A0A7C2P2K8_9PLAN